ncbi:MAG TPA: phosphoribosylamine--glycine ligase [Cyclobacteriaceae bacterium]|nr:phosphoribosylamine--glycine ligase [Cyclobacteriaceae bacterium]
MNILLIGSGGREHALAWKIKQSKLTDKLYIAPGNAGTSLVGENLSIRADDFDLLGKACIDKKIHLVVVGPEIPLVKGVRDYFEVRPALQHILIVGPGKSGARLEGSKDFSKQFMLRHGIPTAKARTFSSDQLEQGLHYLTTCDFPIVLKADGLASGKGVIICQNLTEAQSTLNEMLGERLFGDASANVLIEEFLEGIELSVFVLTDGKDYVLLPEAKDYKRIGENDTGLNTGGMGAVSPVAFATPAFMQKVETKIIRPTISGLNAEHIAYRGFIFFGLIRVKGEPFVIEYNARMGDPETEAVMPRIQSDIVELLVACAEGDLKNRKIQIYPEYALTVMMVSGGYPGEFERGKKIKGLNDVASAHVFHAGTKTIGTGIQTDGGRVIAVTGKGKDIETARTAAYGAISGISWDGVYFRMDIGLDLQNLDS